MTVLRRVHSGFSLIELITILSIGAILSVIAIPSFVSFIQNNRLSGQTNTLVAALHFARSEAIKRGSPVTVCPSTNGKTCITGSWSNGWIVFTDDGITGTVDGGDTILRYDHHDTPSLSLTLNNANYITFSPMGFLLTNQTRIHFSLCLNHRSGETGRQIIINNAGRISTTKIICN